MKLDIAVLNKMTEDELRQLNSTVVAILKGRIKSQQVIAAQKFFKGQKVEWDSKRGFPIQGTITKVKIKMIEVDAGQHGRWNVTATMLRPVQ